MTSVSIISEPSAMLIAADEWEDLASHCAESNAFYHPALLQPALDYLAPAGRVQVVEARKGEQLIALMPVITMARHSRYPVRNVTNWAHDQCFYAAPLLRRGQEVEGWSGLLRALDRASGLGNFLHLSRMDVNGPAVKALYESCARDNRRMKQIHQYERAMLQSGLSADQYWAEHMRAKKRKEIRRLINRLNENGTVTHRHLTDTAQVHDWAADFLSLEASGWKGERGTALANNPATQTYFTHILSRAAKANMLDMIRIDMDDRPIAMLVNFHHLRGAFSYKIAFDESYARYSPGILIEIDNLHAALGDGIAPRACDWMDSCAAPGHPMIDILWAERRSIGQFRVALNGSGTTGLTRKAAYAAVSLAEETLRSIRKDK